MNDHSPKEFGAFCIITLNFKILKFYAIERIYKANLTLAIVTALRSDQTSRWAQPDVFIDPAEIRLFTNAKQSFVASAQFAL